MEVTKKRFTLDLDPAFQRRLKVISALRGVTMRQFCLVAIDRELAREEAEGATSLPFGEEALNRLASVQSEVFQGKTASGDSVDLIREARSPVKKYRGHLKNLAGRDSDELVREMRD